MELVLNDVDFGRGFCALQLSVWLGDEFARDVAVFTGSLIILLITLACIGRLIPLGLFFLLFSPLFAARLRGRIGTQARRAADPSV